VQAVTNDPSTYEAELREQYREQQAVIAELEAVLNDPGEPGMYYEAIEMLDLAHRHIEEIADEIAAISGIQALLPPC
jgi:hypothetical protein